MDKNEAIAILEEYKRLSDIYINANSPILFEHKEAIQMAIDAIKNMGCGCGLCLAHNNMICPKMNNPNLPESTSF